MKKRYTEISDYDTHETTTMINAKKPLSLGDIGFKLPAVTPTQVVSLRLPTTLLNQLRAHASAQDIPYQALIKHLLSKAVRRSM